MKNFIVQLFCLFIIIQGPYSFILGETLEDFLKRNTPMSEKEVKIVVQDLCDIANVQGSIQITYEYIQEANKQYLLYKKNKEINQLENKIDKLQKNIQHKLDQPAPIPEKKNVPK